MKNILILYHTRHGQTQKISEYIATNLSVNFKVTLQNINTLIDQTIPEQVVDDQALDHLQLDHPRKYDLIVLACPIYYGHHDSFISKLMLKNAPLLERIPCAFFSVNLTARKALKSDPNNNPYLLKFLKTLTFKPKLIAVFAGKLQYPSYGFFDKLMIQFIMKITQGVTDTSKIIEYTDWNKVDNFCNLIASNLNESNLNESNLNTNNLNTNNLNTNNLTE
ncbi:protoporphyrinogen oxidase [Gammaproteobacteria bacterium]|nr:protoporphyrinogen oxidase [Gammaproteobacteria bacterium]